VQERGRAEKIDVEGLRDVGLRQAWRQLAELRGNPFLSPEWFDVATEGIPEEEPHAIGWWDGGELRGVLPLVCVRRGPLRLLRFPNSLRGDWFGPACRVEDETAMAAACGPLLESGSGRWNALLMNRVDAASSWPQALVESAPRLRLAPRRRVDALPYIALGTGGYEAYLAGRSRNFRSQLGRRRRKLEREHGLCFRLSEDPARLGSDMDAFFRLHDERWRHRGGSTLSNARSRRLQLAFATAAQRLGWLRLWIAEADGEPAAAWYGWRVGDRYCYALAGLAGRFEKDGLGTVLLGHTIERAAAEGAQIYDLMWGDEAYKDRFATDRREAGTWYLSSGAASHLALRAAVRGSRRLGSLSPRLRGPLRRARRRLRRS
jgi:CelD/BcsL family acetyltransferase involved in cellulose biosynthesis